MTTSYESSAIVHLGLLALALALSCLSACSGGSDASVSPTGNFALVTTLANPDGQTSYLTRVDDIVQARTVDTTAAIEVRGAAVIFGQDGSRRFSVGNSEAGVVARFKLNTSEKLEFDASLLDLEPQGITSAFKRPDLVPFISSSKAYWLDEATLQAVIWNPDEMTVTGTFSLEAAEREGWNLQFGQAVMRDQLIFVGAVYYSDEVGDAGQAVVLVLDSVEDKLVDVLHDDRCGATGALMMTTDGDLLLGTTPYGAALHALDRPEGYPAPCLLRIAANTQTIDPDFYVPLTDIAGGNVAGGLARGKNGSAYVLALHQDLLDEPLSPETDAHSPYEAKAWRWWRFDTRTFAPGSVVPGAPTLSGATRVLSVGGDQYIADDDSEDMATTLLVPQLDGSLKSGLKVPGSPYGLLRLQSERD